MRQRGLVRPPGQPLVARHALPFQARRGRRARRLQLDRGQRRVPHLGEDARRFAAPAHARRAQGPFERPLLDGEVPLRFAVPPERQQHVAGLAPAAERDVGRRRPVEPRLVVAALGLVVFEQLAIELQRLARPPLAERLLGPLARLDLFLGRHQTLPSEARVCGCL